MKKTMLMLVLALGMTYSTSSQIKIDFRKSCSVVCINNSWIIKSYNKNEKCALNIGAKGIISVHKTYDVFVKTHNSKEFIEFNIGILQKSDDTMILFSSETFKTIKAEEVLKKCEAGDKIVIILKNQGDYSLPHHMIEVVDNC